MQIEILILFNNFTCTVSILETTDTEDGLDGDELKSEKNSSETLT